MWTYRLALSSLKYQPHYQDAPLITLPQSIPILGTIEPPFPHRAILPTCPVVAPCPALSAHHEITATEGCPIQLIPPVDLILLFSDSLQGFFLF